MMSQTRQYSVPSIGCEKGWNWYGVGSHGSSHNLIKSPLPKAFLHQYQYQGFWCANEEIVQAVISFQNYFQARDSDMVVASIPKSGTTWLKALSFAIVNRHRFQIKTRPLLTSNPHDLVPVLELDFYMNNQYPDLSKLPEPRLFGTHIPFPSLGTITESHCKIIYICRNPFDLFVSAWYLFNKVKAKSLDPLSLEKAFDMFCKGKSGYGPFWDHILGYWNESLKRPQNVLFLKYEDVKADVVLHLKRLAKFLQYPFTEEEEERNGLIEDITELCSFETMSKLEINNTGTSTALNIENKNLFRKAEVRDWVNYFTPMMVEKMSKLIDDKFGGSGLTFKGIPKLEDYPAKLAS